MSRNRTLVEQYRAEFKALPFGRPHWQITGAFESARVEPYAVSTILRDLAEMYPAGISGLDATEIAARYPGIAARGFTHVVFVPNGNGSRFGTAVLLRKVSPRFTL